MSDPSGSTVKLYRLYNWVQGHYGVPIALCDEHAAMLRQATKEQCLPPEVIALQPLWPCAQCPKIPEEESK